MRGRKCCGYSMYWCHNILETPIFSGSPGSLFAMGIWGSFWENRDPPYTFLLNFLVVYSMSAQQEVVWSVDSFVIVLYSMQSVNYD